MEFKNKLVVVALYAALLSTSAAFAAAPKPVTTIVDPRVRPVVVPTFRQRLAAYVTARTPTQQTVVNTGCNATAAAMAVCAVPCTALGTVSLNPALAGLGAALTAGAYGVKSDAVKAAVQARITAAANAVQAVCAKTKGFLTGQKALDNTPSGLGAPVGCRVPTMVERNERYHQNRAAEDARQAELERAKTPAIIAEVLAADERLRIDARAHTLEPGTAIRLPDVVSVPVFIPLCEPVAPAPVVNIVDETASVVVSSHTGRAPSTASAIQRNAAALRLEVARVAAAEAVVARAQAQAKAKKAPKRAAVAPVAEEGRRVQPKRAAKK